MDERFDTPADRRIADLAHAQHGVVGFQQLLALGIGRGAIEKRVRARRLIPLHVGVYAVGHTRLSAMGRRTAALLACGPGAVLSHHTAGDHLNVRPNASPIIHVTVPTTAGRSQPRIRVHRTRRPREQDVIVHEGLAVTSVARTLLDLSATLEVAQLRKAIERAMRNGTYDHDAMLDLIPGRPTRKLRAALAQADPADVNSNLESDFLALCREHDLPRPEVNVWLGDRQVDFLWRERRVIVEVDSWKYHRGRYAFGDDRSKDVDLTLEGFTVLRFTDEDVAERPGTTAAKLRPLVATLRASAT
jgi:very-short-patch-repair endonuclease